MAEIRGLLAFVRVDVVEETERGIEARLHGERLQVDVVREDVVRIRISRGGTFEDRPTFAVCVDPLGAPRRLHGRAGRGRVRVRTSRLTLTLTRDPFGLDVHRADGSPGRDRSRSLPYATLNDAFAISRRCRPEDAFYGLGEKGGPHNRKRRDYTLWNTDVLDDNATAEFVARRAPDDPRADPNHVEFDPYYVSIPFFYHHRQPAGEMAASFVDNGYRAEYDFCQPERYPIRFGGGQYCEYVFAGPRMPDILEGLHVAHRRGRPPRRCGRSATTSAAGSATRRRRSRRSRAPSRARRAVRRALARHRVHGRLPRLHLGRGGVPRPARHARSGSASTASGSSRSSTPASSTSPGYRIFDQAVEGDVLCRTEGGDVYVGQVWPGDTAFPDFVTEEARAWWGELNAAHVQSGLAGIWNDMNEPATGDIAAGADALRPRARTSHERYHNQYALLMAMGTTAGPARGAARPAHVRALPRGLLRHPALRGELDGRQPRRAGTTCG